MPVVPATVRIRTDSGEELLDLEELEARIGRGEVAPYCMVQFPTPRGPQWVRAGELELYRTLFHPARHAFARRFRLARVPWITLALVAANFAVFWAMKRQGPLDTDAMVRWGGKVLPLIGDLGQTWRLLTANFIHRGWLHIGFNMFMVFSVGGALENVYRPLDYLALLLASALGCTLTSLAFASDAISIGASGVVFGCLGAAAVFGLRYREVLPARYRQLLGEAAIPLFLVFLYMGWTSPGVDNWGHLGGLLFGAAAAGVLPARLMLTRKTPWASSLLRGAALVAVVAAVCGGGALLAPALPPLHRVRDETFGLSVSVPETWRRGVERLAPLAFHNAMPGLGRAVFAVTPKLVPEGATLQAQVEAFEEGDLQGLAASGDLSDLVLAQPVPAEVAGHDALQLDARYTSPDSGATLVRAYFVPRGSTVYVLAFRLPADYPDYLRVAEAMVQTVRFIAPTALRRAQARVLLDPDDPWGLAALGANLAQLGEPLQAAHLLARAERLAPGEPRLPAQEAMALFAAGQVDQGCMAASRAGPAVGDAKRAVWVAQAACARAQGDEARAARLLQQAQVLGPERSR